jgi:hypothetical protein
MHARLRLRLPGCNQASTFPCNRERTCCTRNSKSCVRRRFPLSTRLFGAVLRVVLTTPEVSFPGLRKVSRVHKSWFFRFTAITKTGLCTRAPTKSSQDSRESTAQNVAVQFFSFVGCRTSSDLEKAAFTTPRVLVLTSMRCMSRWAAGVRGMEVAGWCFEAGIKRDPNAVTLSRVTLQISLHLRPVASCAASL